MSQPKITLSAAFTAVALVGAEYIKHKRKGAAAKAKWTEGVIREIEVNLAPHCRPFTKDDLDIPVENTPRAEGIAAFTGAILAQHIRCYAPARNRAAEMGLNPNALSSEDIKRFLKENKKDSFGVKTIRADLDEIMRDNGYWIRRNQQLRDKLLGKPETKADKEAVGFGGPSTADEPAVETVNGKEIEMSIDWLLDNVPHGMLIAAATVAADNMSAEEQQKSVAAIEAMAADAAAVA